MRLYVLSDYRNTSRGESWKAGEEIEVDEDKAAFLLADAPSCFSKESPAGAAGKAVKAPARDKAVKASPKDKDGGGEDAEE